MPLRLTAKPQVDISNEGSQTQKIPFLGKRPFFSKNSQIFF